MKQLAGDCVRTVQQPGNSGDVVGSVGGLGRGSNDQSPQDEARYVKETLVTLDGDLIEKGAGFL